MGRGLARSVAQSLLGAAHRALAVEPSGDELAHDAWVIAPHPDDEVLGCGGTIARKIEAGARVHVCFLTDGSSSHRESMDRETLSATREAEATAACGILGVPVGDVVFLGFEDGRLAEHAQDAADALSEVLRAHPTAEVYVPHHREEPEDHRAACWVARTAIAESLPDATYLEYPVWCWNEWPWVRVGGAGPARTAVRSVRGWARSWRLARESGRRVPIDDVVERKRRALDAHASQMVGLEGIDDGPTLQTFAGGDFLARFFGPYELFVRFEATPRASKVRLTRAPSALRR